MNFAIQINSSPYGNPGADTAYHFIRAAIAKGHTIDRVLFYHDGIYNAFRFVRTPSDERPVVKRWSDLAQQSGIDLVVCVSAAQRRGLLPVPVAEAQQASKKDIDLADGFRIAGLGQFAEAAINADRYLVFGS